MSLPDTIYITRKLGTRTILLGLLAFLNCSAVFAQVSGTFTPCDPINIELNAEVSTSEPPLDKTASIELTSRRQITVTYILRASLNGVSTGTASVSLDQNNYATSSSNIADEFTITLEPGLHYMEISASNNTSAISTTKAYIRITSPSAGALTVTRPSGPNSRTQGEGTTFYTSTITGSPTSVVWTLSPSSAGSISNGLVTWNADFAGMAHVSVMASNSCSSASSALDVIVSALTDPLCENLLNPASTFSADNTGTIVFGPSNMCPVGSFSCLSGGNSVQSRVVATAATTFDHSWTPAEYAGANPYQDGYAGKWRAKTTYAYNTSLTQETGNRNRNYIVGTFTANPFSWTSESNPQSWVAATTVTQYSQNGEAAEERDVLGNYSAAKFGYGGSVPYLVAQNATNNSVLFESFENTYTNTVLEDKVAIQGTLVPEAHSGRQSLQLNGSFATRPFVMTDKLKNGGIWCKVWIRVGTGKDKDLAAMQQQADQLQWQLNGSTSVPVQVVAQVGKWSLCEALIQPSQLGSIAAGQTFTPTLVYSGSESVFIDDVRIQPADAQMICYVYDESLRPVATFDDQHFGMYYQYNSEGKLIRKLIETERGMKMVQETQYNIPKVDR
ncbi:hypothetical protein [Xanthocytophaga agilis]|uniref:Ig-like domain-containing protein n=1 Tax=Xanthocytophaga agilis TaxID=3048010 RepID=A0AAE3UFB9_9BACT|nr:hypothetical protein [Xanthocytophaga agilis]MDJ1501197.1 hypothetical protein [Xanthocytophaga agilis]